MSKLKSIFILVLSIFITTALGFSSFRLYRYLLAKQMVQVKYLITEIIQTGPEREALPSAFLAELMDLSYNEPSNFYSFDEMVAREKLLKCPVIKSAEVKKVKPHSVYVDYEVYKPSALLEDEENVALDERGVKFPLSPFFFAKNLPLFTFGQKEDYLNKFQLAMAILSFLDQREAFQGVFVKRIDTTNAFHESFGKREVVITLEEKDKSCYLRTTPHKFPEELAHFAYMSSMWKEGRSKKSVIDLRLSKVAYIEEIPD
jgi:hypothetical protein